MKADKIELERIESLSKPERAASVFNDMIMLFDSTTLKYDQKISQEI